MFTGCQMCTVSNLPLEIHIEIIERLNLKQAFNYCIALDIPQEIACQYFNYDFYYYWGACDDESESENLYEYWKKQDFYILQLKRILRFCYRFSHILKSANNRKAICKNKKLNKDYEHVMEYFK